MYYDESMLRAFIREGEGAMRDLPVKKKKKMIFKRKNGLGEKRK